MSRFYKMIENPRTKEKIEIDASTYQALMNKEKKQYVIWEQQFQEQEFIKYKSMKFMQISAYDNKIKIFTQIIAKNISLNVSYKDFFKEIDVSDYNPRFRSKIKKPDIESVFTSHGVPKKKPFAEIFSKKTYEKRIRLELEANEIFQQQLIDFENSLIVERSEFEKEVQTYRVNIEKQNVIIRNRLSRFLLKDKDEVKLVLKGFFESQKYIDVGTEGNNKYNPSLDYLPDSGCISISRMIPSIDEMPKYSSLKWNERKKDIDGVEWKKRELTKFHEDVVFQLALVTIKNVFDLFPAEVVSKVEFNGWLNLINPATGKNEKISLVYIKTDRGFFMKLNLLNVDYRACITYLNGDISPSFTEYTYIKPKQDTKKVDQKVQSTRKASAYRSDKINSRVSEARNKDYVSNSSTKNKKKTTPDFDLDFDDE